VTGGTPASTGVHYAVAFDRALLPAGATSCPRGARTGAELVYAENLDRDTKSLDAGQGLTGLPTASFAARYLRARPGHGTDATGAPKAYTHSGPAAVLTGPAAARRLGVRGR
jgi:hypothetical protein